MKFSNRYIFIFITIIVVICAAILTLASVGLQPIQNANREREKMTQILKASGYSDIQDVIPFFKKVSEEITLKGEKNDLLVYQVKTKDGQPCFVMPVRGKGLWGPIWGYIAVKQDGKTINGAVFDHKSETPGLGAEINTDKFMSQFEGKLLFDENGDFTSIRVVKGGVLNSNIDPSMGVDAISGGTITSQGLEKMLKNSLEPYISFLKELQTKSVIQK
ncbi:MAG TPA: NADH:ubiquinone reductase (Na(+)-transporting) subunit C [Bacteroidales bacterium]|jgi:Na+-transporting NADH:ubiquinone oxidoreductase subunit C|nr:NADH:ubiquinone reductase (Na(+)-transporting) subunit C [Bacteroidales bacterium]HPE39601.1 NADH:ubiquinone reductase (Na(+)-transporting) subunit C [Bacteroidales bacterium]